MSSRQSITIYVIASAKGRLKESDDDNRRLSADARQHANTAARKGGGNRGDR